MKDLIGEVLCGVCLQCDLEHGLRQDNDDIVVHIQIPLHSVMVLDYETRMNCTP